MQLDPEPPWPLKAKGEEPNLPAAQRSKAFFFFCALCECSFYEFRSLKTEYFPLRCTNTVGDVNKPNKGFQPFLARRQSSFLTALRMAEWWCHRGAGLPTLTLTSAMFPLPHPTLHPPSARVFLHGMRHWAVEPLKLYGQFYLLIGRYLLQTQYMAEPLITEVRSDSSAAAGKRSAPLLSQWQVRWQQQRAFYSAELRFYIRVYYQVVCSEFVYGGNSLLSVKLSFERHQDGLRPPGGRLCGAVVPPAVLLDTPR